MGLGGLGYNKKLDMGLGGLGDNEKFDLGLGDNLNFSTGLGVMDLGGMGVKKNVNTGLGANEFSSQRRELGLGGDPLGDDLNFTGQTPITIDLRPKVKDPVKDTDPVLQPKVKDPVLELRPEMSVGHDLFSKPSLFPDNRTHFFDKGKKIISSQAHSLVIPKARAWANVRTTCSEGWEWQTRLNLGKQDICKVNTAEKRRIGRPKLRSDFIRGHICRWEPLDVTSRSSNSC